MSVRRCKAIESHIYHGKTKCDKRCESLISDKLFEYDRTVFLTDSERKGLKKNMARNGQKY